MLNFAVSKSVIKKKKYFTIYALTFLLQCPIFAVCTSKTKDSPGMFSSRHPESRWPKSSMPLNSLLALAIWQLSPYQVKMQLWNQFPAYLFTHLCLFCFGLIWLFAGWESLVHNIFWTYLHFYHERQKIWGMGSSPPDIYKLSLIISHRDDFHKTYFSTQSYYRKV